MMSTINPNWRCRANMARCCRLTFLLLGVLVVNFQLAIRQGEFAEPISITLEGFSATEIAGARLFAVYIGSDQLVPTSSPGVWECPRRCVVTTALYFPEKPATETGIVHVKIGERTWTTPLHKLRWETDAYWLTDDIIVRDPPRFAMCRNWPGINAFLMYYTARTTPGLAVVLVLVGIIAIAMRRSKRQRFQEFVGFATWGQAAVESNVQDEKPGRTCWNFIGWLGLIGGFIGLQFLEPYYFTQDDALMGELPGILLGCRSLWEGTFPDWNRYVFLGSPLATVRFQSDRK